MKTNVVMSSQDRILFGVKIRQETKTHMLNLSDLEKAYKNAAYIHKWADRNITEILNGKSNSERIYYLLEKQGIIKVDISSFIDEYQKSPAKTLKRYGAYKTTGARHTKTVWANPYIWMLVAMEMNPRLYAETVTWLTDKLILERIEAGNFYKEFSKAVYSWNPSFPKLAVLLNKIVFGRHEKNIRNKASQTELNALVDVQKTLAFSIKMGFIKDETKLINTMQKMCNENLLK